jgi:RND family efflux transporter MFP subunit
MFMYIRLFIVVITILVLPACGKLPESEIREGARPVKMMTLGSVGGKISLEYPGVIAAVRSVELGFEVPGKIIELPITKGQEVLEGDLLARLDPMDYRAARDSAESHRRALSAAYNRAKRIFDQNAGSQAEVDQALRNIQVAKEELKSAQKALDDTYLKAPFSGQIAKIPADNFQNVRAKEPILLIHDLSSLEIDVTVPEQDIALSPPGISNEERTRRMQPEIEISALPGKRFPAQVHSLVTTADPVTRTYKATFAFANSADFNLLPGMTAKVILHFNTEELMVAGVSGLMIPAAAIAVDEQSNAYVWRVDSDTMQVSRMWVTLGEIAGANVRVLSGLEQGDRIAISGVHHLREGMQVRPLGE